MTVKRLAEIVLAAKLLAEAAKLEGDHARRLLGPAMAEATSEKAPVFAADGATRLGHVTRTAGKVTARVVDERALLQWCRHRRPGEVIEIVRPSYLTTLLEFARRNGDACDPGTGEVIPGIEVSRGAPYVQAYPTQEARDRMRTLLAQSGALPMIEGVPDAEASS